MSVTPGVRLGEYEILGLLGAGGMGEVYRARDLRLGRDVAIKVLRADLAPDPERVDRFERETRMLASLNHPHIAGIYGIVESSGTPALVLELVEGPTLADRIASGPVPMPMALDRQTHGRIDGTRFLVNVPPGAEDVTPITIVLNWQLALSN
jgi:serine/threonine protein kinase